jgi:hypothetical protein
LIFQTGHGGRFTYFNIYFYTVTTKSQPKKRKWGRNKDKKLQILVLHEMKKSVSVCALREPVSPESIEWFIEDQIYLRSYDSAPRPPPPLPYSRHSSCFSFSVFLYMSPVDFTDRRGGGNGGGAKSYDHEKARSSRNHSMPSGVAHIV